MILFSQFLFSIFDGEKGGNCLKIPTEDAVLLSLFELFGAPCTSRAVCNFGSFERLLRRTSAFMLAQVGSSSYTEGDLKRKTSSECIGEAT